MGRQIVYGVGSHISADIYSSRGQAIAAALACVQDPYWQSKLRPEYQKVLAALLEHTDDPEMAIDYYNEHAPDGYKWYVTECEVRDVAAQQSSQAGGSE